MLTELDKYLEISHHNDTWRDSAVDYATELLDKLNDEEWDKLFSLSKVRSKAWQMRLMDAATTSDHPNSTALIAQFLNFSEDIGLYALDILGATTMEEFRPDPSYRDILKNLKTVARNDRQQAVAEELLSRIQ